MNRANLLKILIAETIHEFDEDSWFHDDLPYDEQLDIAKNGSVEDKIQLSKNLNIHPEIQNILSKDRSLKVRFGLIHNKNVDPKIVYKLILEKIELNSIFIKFINLFYSKYGRKPTAKEIKDFFSF